MAQAAGANSQQGWLRRITADSWKYRRKVLLALGSSLGGMAVTALVPLLPRAVGSALRVRVPARDVLVATAVPIGLSARNVLSGRVAALIPDGHAVMVEIACGGAVLAARGFWIPRRRPQTVTLIHLEEARP